MRGLVFNIQRFSLDDGPGIRTTIFLKGCTLRCEWCHNPESINTDQEIQFFHQNCTGCGNCINLCSQKAHKAVGRDILFLRNLCEKCGECVPGCYFKALKIAGEKTSVDELLVEIIKDRAFYETSGGGITLSGGEPLLQSAFVKGVLEECKKLKIHTIVDTAGNVPWSNFEDVLSSVDLFLYDIKLFDEKTHISATGASNKTIIKNLENLVKAKANIWVRVPIIPNINDNEQEIINIAEFVRKFGGISQVRLLRYHNMGEYKYKTLGIQNEYSSDKVLTDIDMNKFANVFREKCPGLEILI
ncbi:MAG: glycyl-radical enzyme activating protein [Ruminiclostridium sp.]